MTQEEREQLIFEYESFPDAQIEKEADEAITDYMTALESDPSYYVPVISSKQEELLAFIKEIMAFNCLIFIQTKKENYEICQKLFKCIYLCSLTLISDFKNYYTFDKDDQNTIDKILKACKKQFGELMDNYDEKEIIGQNLFVNWALSKGNIKYKFSVKGSAEDVKFQSGDTFYMGEIKCRLDCDISIAIKYGPYVEFTKWVSLKKKQEQIQRKKNVKIELIYINFYRGGYVIYELKDIRNKVFKWELLPESYFDKTKIDKYVYALQEPPLETNKYEV